MNTTLCAELEETIAKALGMQSQYEENPDACKEKIEEILQEATVENSNKYYSVENPPSWKK